VPKIAPTSIAAGQAGIRRRLTVPRRNTPTEAILRHGNR
jgi:hypothetical protein